ncbi:hypothetical protein A3J36_01435 [Candidatus Uhrbacteria bacterium RIFCSPLOWO2_02_FULL_54_37]|uniref:Uncharacterized protein n=1 Tax=Candidatus Uhrbacteria bacterium RIFCSPLOWO2_02_FULL_54_37 TaxID=1802412 RepID=A0A1F7VHU6_9BACT|nr:MAG: hypothetical protein A3J36_01435 [Candidatus Uhrbacteria bacterium RIFCSPLOWO2_02_FULL_54_37]
MTAGTAGAGAAALLLELLELELLLELLDVLLPVLVDATHFPLAVESVIVNTWFPVGAKIN